MRGESRLILSIYHKRNHYCLPYNELMLSLLYTYKLSDIII